LRFVDFLRSTVMLSAGAATTLGVITVLAAGRSSDDVLVFVCAGWWLAAAAIGSWLGRRAAATPPIARVLADAKNATMLPEHRPGSVLLNRLWPLLISMIVAGGLAVIVPQVTGIATGFAIIWALAWRRQDAAVAAIEERDGARFYVLRTPPLRPIALERTPGFKALRPEHTNGAVT
jgi:hypothetical protein